MKSLRLLTKQMNRWWKTSKSIALGRSDPLSRPTPLGQVRLHQQINHSPILLRIFDAFKKVVASILPPRVPRRKRLSVRSPQRATILILAIISLTSVIGYRFYNDPQLAVGTIAPQTLRAPASAKVVDVKTTEASRQAARLGSTPVLMVDQTINQEIYQSLQRLLDEGNTLRQQAGAYPFVEPSTLSVATQQYLRQSPEAEWKSILDSMTSTETNETSSETNSSRLFSTTNRVTLTTELPDSAHQLALIELQNHQQTASKEDFATLRQVIMRARQRYLNAIKSLAGSPEEPRSFYDVTLLNLTDAEWAKTRLGIRQALERILLQGIPAGLPDPILEQVVKVQVAVDVPTEGSGLGIKVLMNVLKPNLVQDPAQTRIRAEQAAQSVEPEVVEIRRGEVIVQQDQIITQSAFVLLDYFGLSRRGINWVGLLGFAALIGGAVTIFLLIERRFHSGLRKRDYLLIWLLTLTAPLTIALNVDTTSLPLVGLLTGSFYGSALGLTLVAFLGIVLPIGMEVSKSQLIASAIAGMVGATMAGRLRSREELAMLGGIVGLTQGAIYLLFNLVLNTGTNPVWYAVLTAAGLQGLLGVACSVLALGLSPYLENLFDLITPIRLAELSNPNRPLLKRLAADAPGTFQHTLFVASLAEAAARALGCNVELVRAGTLYHDIGKMHDPMGFIENQMGKPNKHDFINDPWKSCKIIKKHVSEGLIMARKSRLPRAIQAFIPEHQGTMLIAYFYHQAQEWAKANPKLTVKEADFRYDGPIPQSRETGIVMLADSCEAALRSLKEATPEEALAMVNRILHARWQDNQLVDSGLTRSEMPQIAQIFVRVWQQFNHQRIAYPKVIPPSPQPPQMVK
jgi:putative nucleotidyltransferase with HDIG domain